MDILGIGGAELVMVTLIMLVVAGPKRMIRWAYVIGQYSAKLRAMWREAAAGLQREMDAAGLEIDVPTRPPTKQDVTRTLRRAFDPITRPIQETMEQTRSTLDVRTPVVPTVDAPKHNAGAPLGAWSGQSSADLE